jgi:hypothetical protein
MLLGNMWIIVIVTMFFKIFLYYSICAVISVTFCAPSLFLKNTSGWILCIQTLFKICHFLIFLINMIVSTLPLASNIGCIYTVITH